jgi:hypothetical protein
MVVNWKLFLDPGCCVFLGLDVAEKEPANIPILLNFEVQTQLFFL